jgi:hypothetical protein
VGRSSWRSVLISKIFCGGARASRKRDAEPIFKMWRHEEEAKQQLDGNTQQVVRVEQASLISSI